MVWNQLDISKDNNNKFFGNFQINIEEDREEIALAQKVFNLDGEVSICSKSAIPFLVKCGEDFIELIKDKYPEDIIGDDFIGFVKYLEAIREK